MPFDVAAVQQALKAEKLDGWLLYDFHGSNPIAARLIGTADGAKMTTRRWFYLVPAAGDPKGLVHAIERRTLDALPGQKTVYAGRQQLDVELTKLLSGMKRIAMEYSRECAIPYISRIDAGTIELVRRRGIEVESSGDLVQRFEAVWDDHALATHRKASEALYRVKDRAFETIATDVCAPARSMTEFAVQQQMAAWFEEEGLISDSNPVVAAQENAGDPHYLPTARRHAADSGERARAARSVGEDGRMTRAPYMPILRGWGSRVRTYRMKWRERSGPFAARAMRRLRWCSNRRAIRAICAGGRSIARHGACSWKRDLGNRILHRTGHNLGRDVHGNGVHMDDYESHDDRRLLPGTGFTIEPGLYFDSFGVRTEINMFYGQREALMTGPAQTEIVRLV